MAISIFMFKCLITLVSASFQFQCKMKNCLQELLLMTTRHHQYMNETRSQTGEIELCQTDFRIFAPDTFYNFPQKCGIVAMLNILRFIFNFEFIWINILHFRYSNFLSNLSSFFITPFFVTIRQEYKMFHTRKTSRLRG